jgi:diguanylate cyclase (GGDEF)-like protein/PAS domain S-box-containing protein
MYSGGAGEGIDVSMMDYLEPALWGLAAALVVAALVLVTVWRAGRRRHASAESMVDAIDSTPVGELPAFAEEEATDLAAVAGAVTRLCQRQLESQVLDAGELFHRLVDGVHDAVVLHTDVIVQANSRFAALVGESPSAILGRSLAEFVTPDYTELVADNVARRLRGLPAAERYEVEVTDRQGQVSRMELAGTRVDLARGPAVLFTAVDMLPTRVGQSSASGTGGLLGQTVLDSLSAGVITTDPAGRIDYANRAAEQLLGRPLADMAGRPFEEAAPLMEEADRRMLADPVRQCLTTGARITASRRAMVLSKQDGSERMVELTVAPLRSDRPEPQGCVVLLHDVTEARGIARQMSYQASHDALTGLVNRREFERRLQEAMENARHGGQHHVLCFLDLDRFKAVNDVSGHNAGDQLLRELSTLLRESVRDSDTVARIGGDEFALLLVGCPLEKATQIASNLARAIMEHRFVWKDRIFQVGVSSGLVEVSRESGTLEDVMGAADSACYVAKRSGAGSVHVYSARDEAAARQRGEIHWLQRLQNALRDGHFELHVQPILAAGPETADGPALEVFLRLAEEGGKLAFPGEFMDAAERYRLMSLLDRWVVQDALSAVAAGRLSLPPGRSLAINVSGQTLGDAGFLEYVVDVLDRTGIHPDQLCFEVTESSVVANLDHARRFVAVLHGMGCSFALDDFGNGVGAFANLKTLGIDYLKIDGSFIRNLARDPVSQAMVSAMVKLSRTLNFRIIAEQVEDTTALEAARRMGIDFVQGYAIGRPEPLRKAALQAA